jgi:cation-transporting P-type ATPase I
VIGHLMRPVGLLGAAPAAARGVVSLAGRGAAVAAGAALQVPAAAASVAMVAGPGLRESAEVPRRVVADAATRTGRLVMMTAAQLPEQAVTTAGSLTHQSRSLIETVGREAAPLSKALLDLHPRRSHRRVWSGHGHAQIEVRGMTGSGPRHQRLAAGVKRRLGRLRGVRWAEVNAVTGQVLVAFDEGSVDVGALLGVVRDAEKAQGTREEDFPWSRPVHPSDDTPIAAATVELAADCLAVAAAVVGRVARLPAVPRGVRVAQALLELERPLRRQLKRRVGPIGTDTVLALTGAAVQGLSQGPGMPAVDALYRLELLAEALSRRAVWDRREGQLCCAPDALPREAPVRPPRPRPRPKGPIENWSERLGPGALGAAGLVLALTRHPGRAADMFLVAVPKAARRGREGFATTVGRELARRGVVPLNAAAWRRLDRISAIVLDSPLLCTSRPQILAAEPAPGVDAAVIWQAASHALQDLSIQDLGGEGPWRRADLGLERDPDVNSEAEEPGAVRLLLRQGRRLLGAVTVGGELAPLAEAVLDAARSAGRVLLTRHASVAELLPRADEVLSADRSLADHVLRLQAEGHGVLVVSETADQALAVADVGVAVLGGDACLCWSADLLCGPGLEDLWRILEATAAARPVSERAVKLAQAGSTLGALLALVDSRRQGRPNAMAPVYGAALVALAQGTLTGMRVTWRARPPPVAHVPWHALDGFDVLARLDEARGTQAQPTGGWPVPVTRVRATAARVARMPQVAGVVAPVGAAVRLGAAVREELRDPLTPVLAVGAAASAVVGSSVDALLVAAVMSGNALVSGVERVRAERALRRLFLEQEVPARRLRRHSGDPATAETVAGLGSVPLQTVPASALSPGDVIALRAADVVPADARLLTAVDLEVDESTLTGESLPVDKDVHATPAAPLAERSCMVFDGTTVLAGTAYAVVVATGAATEAGRAAHVAGRAAPRTGVQAQLGELTRIALPATDLGGLAVTGLALLRKLPLRQAVAAGVSVAVAAVPEGLPLVSTVAQAAAARRLSRRGVLVRSARTLEALGRVDVVCFDKTGTLTEGRLAVTHLAWSDAALEMEHPHAHRLLITAARACPPADAQEARTVPHATDRAVLEAAMRLTSQPAGDDWQLRAEVPFQTSRGYAASLGSDQDKPLLAVKGAPEVMLPLCRRVATGSGTQPLTPARRRAAQQTVQRLAADGLRVLAVAERRASLPADSQAVEDLISGLTLLGFVGVADTPRSDAAEAVRQIAQDGVRTVMITGDHPTTAAAIARAVDIPVDGVVTGAKLDRMTESERVRRVAATTVFARVSPEQKLRIVQALQAGGHVVAMTGDGVNDAAAIRLADVGIGVAATGSSSARSAADLVLTGADVRRIHDALLEGRGLWHRVGDAVAILVGGNAGEVAFMVLGTALSGRAPINVRQLLLVNMFTDMFPALAVAVAPSQNETASGPTSGALGTPLARAVAVRGGATTLGALLAWTIGRFTGRGRRASSMGLAALVGTQLGQTLMTGWRSPLVIATVIASAAALVALIEIPVVSEFFGGTPIGPVAWAIVVAATATGTLAAALLPKLVG